MASAACCIARLSREEKKKGVSDSGTGFGLMENFQKSPVLNATEVTLMRLLEAIAGEHVS